MIPKLALMNCAWLCLFLPNTVIFCSLRIGKCALIKTIISSQPVFELSQNKWLSHGQPGYNLWLSVQVFGCPYLVCLYLEYINIHVQKLSFGYRFMVVRQTTASVFWLSGDFFCCPRRTDNQNFERWFRCFKMLSARCKKKWGGGR